MKKFLLVLFIFSVLTACFRKKENFGDISGLTKLGIPLRIEYYHAKEHHAFQYLDTSTFVISDRQELIEAIGEINFAAGTELRKGAGWNRIRLHFTNTILDIHTNDRVIGLDASGEFYRLDSNNFITRRLDKN